jgi:hypothetical protein
MGTFQRGNPSFNMSALFTTPSNRTNIFLPIDYAKGDIIPGDPYTNYINSMCNAKSNSRCVGYNKLVTSGNDPTVSTKSKYSYYVNYSRSKQMTLAEYNALLQKINNG